MAHSRVAKTAGLLVAAVTIMSAAYAAAQNTGEVVIGTTSAQQAELPKWMALPVADVSFYKNNFMTSLETIFQKVGTPAVPNTITPPIQHISRSSEAKAGSKAYTKELESFTKYILRQIVNGDEGAQPTLKMTTNSGGERLEFVSQEKKMTGLYFAWTHEELGVSKITCIGYIQSNNRIHALFTQSSATRFPNCKAEILDLLNTLPIVSAEKAALKKDSKNLKASKTAKSIKTATAE
jgi:hypothetical protein